MTTKLRDERGFTLIELLVVVLIIGILAAVALPTFLGQRDKGFDADAKSNARNVQTLVESCGIANAGDFTNCTTAAQLGDRRGRRDDGEVDYQLAPPVAVLTEPAAIDLVITNVLLVAPDFDFDVAVMT